MSTFTNSITQRPHRPGVEGCIRDTAINFWALVERAGWVGPQTVSSRVSTVSPKRIWRRHGNTRPGTPMRLTHSSAATPKHEGVWPAITPTKSSRWLRRKQPDQATWSAALDDMRVAVETGVLSDNTAEKKRDRVISSIIRVLRAIRGLKFPFLATVGVLRGYTLLPMSEQPFIL
jgi:hypothetical protein